MTTWLRPRTTSRRWTITRAFATLHAPRWFASLATAFLLSGIASGIGSGTAWPQEPGAGSSSASVAVSSTGADVIHLHGVVLDSHTGKPIARALVQGMGDRLATLTDHDGRFAMDMRFTETEGNDTAMRRMQVSQMLSMLLVARKPGYVTRQPMHQQVAVSSQDRGQNRDQDQEIELKLTPEAVIQGRVGATGEDHPEGVRISLSLRRIQNGAGQWAQIASNVTNSRGEFRFGNLEPGEYKLATMEWSDRPQAAPALALALAKPASRYGPVFYPQGSAAAGGASLHVGAGESLQVDLNLHPELFYPVRIPLAFPAAANQGVQIRVLRGSAPTGFYLTYNGRDHAAEGMLPNGAYEIELQSFGQPGYSGATTLTVSGKVLESDTVTMLPAQSIPVVVHQDAQPTQTSQASSAASRRTIVTVRNGAPPGDAPPVQVQLLPEESGRGSYGLAGGRTNSAGLSVDNVLPGTYRVELWSNGGYVAAASSGGSDLLRQPLVVAAGAGVQPIEVTLREDAATVTGTVASDALPGAPAAPLYVFCLPAEPYAQRVPQTFAPLSGAFTLPNVPPGRYRIFASRQSPDSIEYRSEAWIKRNASKGYPVTLEPGVTVTATLTSVLEEEQ